MSSIDPRILEIALKRPEKFFKYTALDGERREWTRNLFRGVHQRLCARARLHEVYRHHAVSRPEYAWRRLENAGEIDRVADGPYCLRSESAVCTQVLCPLDRRWRLFSTRLQHHFVVTLQVERAVLCRLECGLQFPSVVG